MASRELCGSSSVTGLPRNEKLPCASEVLESLWIPKPSSVLYGSKSLINFSENVGGGDTSGTPYFQSLDKEENGYEDFDGCLNPPGKKRRLTASQVQFLEKNFEVENKLEPERKVQLAQQLGLQPRQVAIWFQNRRARFKNQRLEKDYDGLKAVYDKLKVDYDNLLKEKQVLNDQVVSLKDNLLLKEEEKGNLEILDSIKSLEAEEPRKPIMDGDTKTLSIPPMVVCKQEDASSVKSDVFDSDSSHYTDGNHSPLIEPADCSQVFEQEQSDFSQDEEDNPNYNMNLVPPPPCLLKLEEDCYYDTPPTNSCNFGFSVDDHPFWSWSY